MSFCASARHISWPFDPGSPASNDPAKQLYMKHGFEQVGRRKDYYDEPNEDAIIMTKYFQAEQPDENDE